MGRQAQEQGWHDVEERHEEAYDDARQVQRQHEPDEALNREAESAVASASPDSKNDKRQHRCMPIPDPPERSDTYYRHRLPIRIMHWVNVFAFFLLLMSGLQIFNAHPVLDWGRSSYNGSKPFLEIGSRNENGKAIGVTRIAGHEFVTTGVLGVSGDGEGNYQDRAFPAWATLPGSQWLAMARSWHFFFGWIFVLNGLAYVYYGIATRHLRKDLVPTAVETRQIGSSLRDHLLLRHPTGEAAKHYNVLQKLTYLLVLFVLLPGIILMGWAMSPWLDSLLPGWVDVLGGRQSARTLHFIFAFLLLAFVAVHVFEVIVTGLWNNLRSMITGRYVLPEKEKHE